MNKKRGHGSPHSSSSPKRIAKKLRQDKSKYLRYNKPIEVTINTLEGKENLFDDIFNNEQQKEIRNILKEKDKNKFTTKLKEILLDNYYEKNKIKELKCN